MDLATTLLALPPIMVLHELGHALAAELLFGRGSVGRFSLGLPPVAFRLFTWRGIEFAIGRLPLGASTGIRRAAHDRAGRAAKLGVALAGSAVNLVCALLFWGTPFALLNLVLGLFQLLPIPGGFDGGHLIVDLLDLRGERRAAWERRGRRLTIAGSIFIVVFSVLVMVAA